MILWIDFEAFNAQMQKKQNELLAKEQELAILKDKLAGIEDKKMRLFDEAREANSPEEQ